MNFDKYATATQGAMIEQAVPGVLDSAANELAVAIERVQKLTRRTCGLADRVLGAQPQSAEKEVPPGLPSGCAYQLAAGVTLLHRSLMSLESELARLESL